MRIAIVVQNGAGDGFVDYSGDCGQPTRLILRRKCLGLSNLCSKMTP
jgi:hypothetical protein